MKDIYSTKPDEKVLPAKILGFIALGLSVMTGLLFAIPYSLTHSYSHGGMAFLLFSLAGPVFAFSFVSLMICETNKILAGISMIPLIPVSAFYLLLSFNNSDVTLLLNIVVFLTAVIIDIVAIVFIFGIKSKRSLATKKLLISIVVALCAVFFLFVYSIFCIVASDSHVPDIETPSTNNSSEIFDDVSSETLTPAVDNDDTTSETNKSSQPKETTSTQTTETITQKPAETNKPTVTSSPKETTTKPSATTGQANALSEAKSYLRFSSFSREGLIGQLEFEGYTHEEAVYGVDNCGADWYEQALEKAKSYLEYSSFSYQGLIDQLEFEEFTSEQATYGVDNCGADWYEQAAQKAADYLEFSSFSREGLIDQLEFEGFTHDQAVYGVEANGY